MTNAARSTWLTRRMYVLSVSALTTTAALGAGSCAMPANAQRLSGRDRAQQLAQAVGRALGVSDPDRIDFTRWHDFVPVGDVTFVYHPERDVLTARASTGTVDLWNDDLTPKETAAVRRALRGENDPAVGGMFEHGGAYSYPTKQTGDGALAADYPVATVGSGQVRQGVEYYLNLAATWRLRWIYWIAGLVHHHSDAEPLTGPVIWNDERRALDTDVSHLSGRARADAVVRAYLAHRLVQRTSLGRANPAGRLFGEVPDVYDGGDYYLRYDAAHDQLEAGVFVATPADLARLQKAGVFGDRLVAALGAGAPVPGDQATPTRLGPAFTRPAPLAGGAAPVATAFVVQRPPGRPDAPTLLYLTQRYTVAGLTPRALDLALEPLLDYGNVWRHRWLWRAARMVLGTERPPTAPLVRTPDDYGFDPATERLDAPPAAPGTPS